MLHLCIKPVHYNEYFDKTVCWSTRPSIHVVTMLSTHPYVSSCLWFNTHCAHMRLLTILSLVQMTACRLVRAGLLWIGPLAMNFGEIWIRMQPFSYKQKKCVFKMAEKALENKRESIWWQISSKALVCLEWGNLTIVNNLYFQNIIFSNHFD